MSETKEELIERLKDLDASFDDPTGPRHVKWLRQNVEMLTKMYGRQYAIVAYGAK